MVPVLLNMPGLKLYTFGIFLMLAFFWGCFMVWHTIRLSSYKEEDIFDGLFISLGVAIFTGRLAYAALHFPDFGFSISRFILINGYPGISLYGAIVGGVVSFALYASRRKLTVLEVYDYLVSGMFLALAIGKLGAFFSGVEVGAKTGIPLAVVYAGYEGYRHLSSLYEALFFFIGAYCGYRLLLRIRRETVKRGMGLVFFIGYFALGNLLFDPLKEPNPTIFPSLVRPVAHGVILLTMLIIFGYYGGYKFFARFGKRTQ